MGLSQDLINPAHNAHAEDFECVICREFVFDPRVCQRCQKIFCSLCIKEWLDKNEKCPFKCSVEKMDLGELQGDQLLNYMRIELKCTKNCGRFISLIDYKDHLATCDLADCPNFSYCNRKACYFYKNGTFCSYLCYKILKFEQNQQKSENDLWKICKLANNFACQRGFFLCWNFNASSKKYKRLSANKVTLDNQGELYFRTLIANVGFYGGFGRVKFVIKKSAFPIKIGVTSTDKFDVETLAFSDLETGFAFYTLGQTRNDSNESGLIFGDRLDLEGECVVEMEINMGEGKLNFWANGANLGSAFEETALTKGPLFPAIACGKNVEEVTIFYEW